VGVTDVVVIGAGLSGLVCARRLVDGGASVTVLEARDRVGGRTLSAPLGSSIIDLGGQWLSAGQTRLAALAAELGVATYPQFREGAALVDLGGKRHRLVGRVLAAISLWRARRAIDRLSRSPDPALDERSLADWLSRSVGSADARAALALHAELTFAASPADLSLYHYLASLHATGGFGSATELAGGGREHRLVGGTQELSLRLAASLSPRIVLSSPVLSIDQSPSSITVRTAATTHTADFAVLAVPPALARSITFTPALPESLSLVAAASRPGAVIKLALAYADPFWRSAGLSGEAYQSQGTIRAVVDLCDPAGQPALLALIVGPEAARWHTRAPSERLARSLSELATLFGPPAASPTDIIEHDWSIDAWSTGCVATQPPGHSTHSWRGPHGRLHLAGTESATTWPGYLDGAIESADRTAAAILS
jgi:monoamine oxidase